LNRCAGGILRPGVLRTPIGLRRGKAARRQEKGAGRIGNTGKPFDEPTTQKTPALRVALRRSPAVSPRRNATQSIQSGHNLL